MSSRSNSNRAFAVPACALAGAVIFAAALGGCAADAQGVPETEAIAAAEEGFGEATCATAPGIEDHNDWSLRPTGVYYSAIAPYAFPGCKDALIVDYFVGASPEVNVNVWAGYYDPPKTEGACLMARARVDTYQWINGSWKFWQRMTRHGAWRGGECFLDLDAGSPQAHLSAGPTRVVAQAYSTFCLLGSCRTTLQSVKTNAFVSM